MPKNKCPSCNNISLNLKKIKSISNPFNLQCNKAKCRKIVNIRNNTIFQFFPNTPMSLLVQSIEALICDGKNATKTIEYINEKYKLSTAGQKTIFKLFNIIRKCIAQYYEETYEFEKLVYDKERKNVCVDESLFVHNCVGEQFWAIGLIDVESKKIRLELVKERSSEVLKKIILHHVGINNTIITDGWDGYNWIGQYSYAHLVHLHSRGQFGRGDASTSYIESIWGIFKGMLTKYYNALTAFNFIYFLRELEFRYNTRDLNSNMKLRELKEFLNYCASTSNYIFYEIDDLNDYYKLGYNIDLEVEGEEEEEDEE